MIKYQIKRTEKKKLLQTRNRLKKNTKKTKCQVYVNTKGKNFNKKTLHQVQRHRNNKKIDNKRHCSKTYLFSIGNGNIKECQIMFLWVTLKQVKNIVQKTRLTNAGMCKADSRDKHSNHKKVNEEDKQIIQNHIKITISVCENQMNPLNITIVFI